MTQILKSLYRSFHQNIQPVIPDILEFLFQSISRVKKNEDLRKYLIRSIKYYLEETNAQGFFKCYIHRIFNDKFMLGSQAVETQIKQLYYEVQIIIIRIFYKEMSVENKIKILYQFIPRLDDPVISFHQQLNIYTALLYFEFINEHSYLIDVILETAFNKLNSLLYSFDEIAKSDKMTVEKNQLEEGSINLRGFDDTIMPMRVFTETYTPVPLSSAISISNIVYNTNLVELEKFVMNMLKSTGNYLGRTKDIHMTRLIHVYKIIKISIKIYVKLLYYYRRPNVSLVTENRMNI